MRCSDALPAPYGKESSYLHAGCQLIDHCVIQKKQEHNRSTPQLIPAGTWPAPDYPHQIPWQCGPGSSAPSTPSPQSGPSPGPVFSGAPPPCLPPPHRHLNKLASAHCYLRQASPRSTPNPPHRQSAPSAPTPSNVAGYHSAWLPPSAFHTLARPCLPALRLALTTASPGGNAGGNTLWAAVRLSLASPRIRPTSGQ